MFTLLLKITRMHLFMVGATSSLVFGSMITGEFQWILMLIVLFDWFQVNLCNTATDWKEDRFNRVSYSKLALNNHKKIITFCSITTSISFLLHYWYLPNLLLPRMIGFLLGFLYNFPVLPGKKRLKQINPLKNLASCLGFIITLFIYPISSFPIANNVDFLFILSLLGFFIPIEISFEIIYDLRDINGDRYAEVHSFPVVYGSAWAKRAVIILDICSISFTLLSLGFEFIEWKQGVIVFGAILHLLVFYYLNLKEFNPSKVIILTWSFVFCQITYVLWILFDFPVEANYFLGELTPIKIIDFSMIFIGILTCSWSTKFFSWKNIFLGYFFISIGGLVCENSVIILYEFYEYNLPIWTVIVGRMPLEVCLIWPQVIFTSYRLMRETFGFSSFKLCFFGCLEVFGLAFFVEICCVSRGFWFWNCSNIAGVPILGVIGWSVFAFCAFYALYALENQNYFPILLLPIYSIFMVHFICVGLWFCGFSIISQYEIPLRYVSISAASSLPILAYLLTHFRKNFELTLVQEFPRLCAAFVLFFTLLKGNPSIDLIIICITFALPFLGALSVGWPDFLLAERRSNINNSRFLSKQS